ncbi:hypothetical protein CAEBREN_13758 [Caenorhabditis brenneri]|uniref:Uncharacterized protein n=1 Tax=Caenorhabditis brenneri TaxID=135651 RepID=G0PIK0_CAEBE|nr:hypothetical protein CAEBREN_13758 [Caenorhabditis brenneri]
MFNEAPAVDARRSLVDNGMNGSLNVMDQTGPYINQEVTSGRMIDNQYSRTGTSSLKSTLNGNSNETFMLAPRVKIFYKGGSTSSTTRTIATKIGCTARRASFVSHQLSSRRHPIFKRTEAPKHPKGCLFCKDTEHSAQHCTVYPDADSRIMFLDENQLCHGCVFKKHETKKCPVYNKKKCKICGGKNHILAICRRQQGLMEHTSTNYSVDQKHLNCSLGSGMLQADSIMTGEDQFDGENSNKLLEK